MPDPIHAAGSMPPPPEPWGTTDRERAAAKWLHSAHRGYWGWTDALPDARQLLAAVDGPEPDWADVREAARKAGLHLKRQPRPGPGSMRSHRAEWSGAVTGPSGDHVWVQVLHYADTIPHDWQITAYRLRPVGEVMREDHRILLHDPTPAEVLTAARLLGLDGGTP